MIWPVSLRMEFKSIFDRVYNIGSFLGDALVLLKQVDRIQYSREVWVSFKYWFWILNYETEVVNYGTLMNRTSRNTCNSISDN